jgi:hypothetical protein
MNKIFKVLQYLFFLRILLNRRIIALVILICLGLYFGPSWYVDSYISNITGTKTDVNFSLLNLLRGDVYFSKLIIYSPDNFRGIKALELSDVKVNINLFHIFNSPKVINSFTINEANINSVYLSNSNNMLEIISNVNSYFKYHPSTSGNIYKIKEVYLRNIHMNTYYYSSTAISSKIPDIFLNNIDSNYNIAGTVSGIIASTIGSNVTKDKENNISWWDKTIHGIGSGINFGVNAIGTGLDLTNNALNTVASVNSSVQSVSSSINSL